MRVLVAVLLASISVSARAQGSVGAPAAVPATDAASTAPASAPPASPTPTATEPAPVPARAADPAAAALQDGLEALRTGRGTDALEALVRARESAPARAEAHYYLGVALRREARLEDALVAFRTCLSVATTSSDATWGVRARIAVADTLERMAGRLPEAREAWLELRGLAEQSTDGIPAELPRARLEAIEARLRLDQEYAVVRQRIADRASGSHEAQGHHGSARHGAHDAPPR